MKFERKFLFLVILFTFTQEIFSSGKRNSLTYRHLPEATASAIDVPQAREALLSSNEISRLVDRYISSDTYLQSLWKRGRRFPCRESFDHNRTCACRNSDVNGYVTLKELVKSVIKEDPRIKDFAVDRDFEDDIYEREAQRYGSSKAPPFIIFRLDQVCEEYEDILTEEKRIYQKWQKNVKTEQKKQQKDLKEQRRRFNKKGVIAVMCSCQCRLHKRCFDKMKKRGVERCVGCQDDITALVNDISCNFVFPESLNGDRESKCKKCRKNLWKL